MRLPNMRGAFDEYYFYKSGYFKSIYFRPSLALTSLVTSVESVVEM